MKRPRRCAAFLARGLIDGPLRAGSQQQWAMGAALEETGEQVRRWRTQCRIRRRYAGGVGASVVVVCRAVIGAAGGPAVGPDLDHEPAPAVGAIPWRLEPPRLLAGLVAGGPGRFSRRGPRVFRVTSRCHRWAGNPAFQRAAAAIAESHAHRRTLPWSLLTGVADEAVPVDEHAFDGASADDVVLVAC
jgi:hypothetical protein